MHGLLFSGSASAYCAEVRWHLMLRKRRSGAERKKRPNGQRRHADGCQHAEERRIMGVRRHWCVGQGQVRSCQECAGLYEVGSVWTLATTIALVRVAEASKSEPGPGPGRRRVISVVQRRARLRHQEEEERERSFTLSRHAIYA
ncbi:hypothetical protein OH77DRAFT_1167595 [Trametes cingulata]|nr:hypothetical protein OH77DRAFT_1167595 [Trametes cingulata]